MVAASVPTAGNYPRKLNKREAKVIEAAAAADGALVQTLTNKTIDGDLNTISDLAVTSLKTVAGNADKVVMGTSSTGVPKFDKVGAVNLAAALVPSHVVKFAGLFTTVGGDAAELISVAGALETDIVLVTVKTAGSTPRSIVAAAAAEDGIQLTMSGDPSSDHILQYVVLRAIA